MRIQTYSGEIIPFDELTVIDDDGNSLYKIQHFEGDEHFNVIKMKDNSSRFENIDDQFMLKSGNVIHVK